jgi:hypothetical protein
MGSSAPPPAAQSFRGFQPRCVPAWPTPLAARGLAAVLARVGPRAVRSCQMSRVRQVVEPGDHEQPTPQSCTDVTAKGAFSARLGSSTPGYRRHRAAADELRPSP